MSLFVCEMVPSLRMKKYTWNIGEIGQKIYLVSKNICVVKYFAKSELEGRHPDMRDIL